MGVGLEAGLAVDAMADKLGELLDRADAAALLRFEIGNALPLSVSNLCQAEGRTGDISNTYESTPEYC